MTIRTRGSVSATSSPFDRTTRPPDASRQGMNGRGRAVSPRLIIPDDVEKRLQPRLHAGVGGVGVNLENQIGLGAQLGAEHRLGERVDGATEVAHAEQKQIRVLAGERHGIEDLVREVPRGRALSPPARGSPPG